LNLGGWWSAQAWATRQALAGGAVLLWLSLVVLLALAVRARWPRQREWSRKLIHIGTGPVVLIAWALGIDRLIALTAAAVVTVLAALNHRARVLPAIEDVGRHSYGTVAYGAAIVVLLALFWPQRPDAVAAGVLVMALGDGIAGLLGASLSSASWTVLGQRKSVAGTAAMGAVSLGVLGVLASSGAAVATPLPLGMVLAGIATTAMLLEQIAVFGIDNLTVPVVAGLLWSALTVPA
jgi:phytol kinase